MSDRKHYPIDQLRVSGAFVVRGDVSDVKAFLSRLEDTLRSHRLDLIYETFDTAELYVTKIRSDRQGI